MARHYVAAGDGVKVFEAPTPAEAKRKALVSVGWGYLGRATVLLETWPKATRRP